MKMEIGGIFGILILAADVWAILNIFQSSATTGSKTLWIVLVLALPLIGVIVWYFAGPRESSA
ncbi:MAG: PLD nuclease N-terminal domain-containing protein [Gammaproteobacteria bacterium]|nr:PLD nuclease N-terminal domain-containing protein [Gammaproteobacteria bacterium]